MVAALFAVWATPGIDPEILMGDPAATVELPKYLGLFSHISVLAWTVAAVTFFGTAYVLRTLGSSTRLVSFCLVGGGILAMLMLDDWLQLHESAGRRGVPPLLIVGIYALAVITWVVFFDKEIARTPTVLLVAGGLMFAASIGIDTFYETSDARWRLLTEDGAKILGILAMAGYAAGTARVLISAQASALEERPHPRSGT